MEVYVSRLPVSKTDGNILLADAEARTLRNLFASEVDILSPAFGSRLKTFLEQHIGLRVYYPEIAQFYHDVQTGRIQEPLSLDAVSGFVQVVRENIPEVFEESVGQIFDESKLIATTDTSPGTGHTDGLAQTSMPAPPKDPLGELDPKRSSDFSFASTANGLWRIFLEGEKIYKSLESWKMAGASLRPYVSEILSWLYRFMPPHSGS